MEGCSHVVTLAWYSSITRQSIDTTKHTDSNFRTYRIFPSASPIYSPTAQAPLVRYAARYVRFAAIRPNTFTASNRVGSRLRGRICVTPRLAGGQQFFPERPLFRVYARVARTLPARIPAAKWVSFDPLSGKTTTSRSLFLLSFFSQRSRAGSFHRERTKGFGFWPGRK